MVRTYSSILTGMLLAALTPPVLAQDDAPAEEWQALLSQQQELLTAQGQQIADQASVIEKQRRQLESLTERMDLMQSQLDDLATSQTGALGTLQQQVDQLAMAAGAETEPSADEIELRERLARLESQVEAEPEAPANVLTAGEFPGSIRLPGTNMAAKLGGFVRVSLVDSIGTVGSEDRFIVGSIPPSDAEMLGDPGNATISAKRSRLNLDLRMDSSVGQFRAFLEGDFAGDGGTDNYRLRHAYGQYNKYLVGQTWSTFVDTLAIPEEIDFEGVSGQINVRQPLLRWNSNLLSDRQAEFSLEDPNPSISGGNGVTVFPDVIVRSKFSFDRGHFRSAVLLRGIRGEIQLEEDGPVMVQTEFGWGVSLSGRSTVDRRGRDNVVYQLNFGDGIGRYINDLGSVGGQDAVFDPETGALETLEAIGGYVAYQRWWRGNRVPRLFRDIRSTFGYSHVKVRNLDFQEETAYKYTRRATMNIIWSPISQIDLGFEVLWGERVNKDDSRGDAVQLQGVATFRF